MTSPTPHDAASRVYEILLDRIVRGDLPPEARIVEREIAAELGVSRTPVRDAVRRLESEGLVLANPASRYARPVVASLTEEDARELHDIVARLEGGAARKAAALPRKRREAMAARLRERNRAFLEASFEPDADVGELVELDHEFHAGYVDEVSGPRLMAMRKAAKPQIARYAWSYALHLIERVPGSAAEHDRIIEAILAGDADAAERAVIENWGQAAARLDEAIELGGE